MSKPSRATSKSSRKLTRKEMDESLEMYQNSRKTSVNDFTTYRLDAKFKNKKQKYLYDTIEDNRITFVKGSAGTGKTFITILAALKTLKLAQSNISNIILSKPIIEAAQSIGFLPGSVEEKIEAYMQSFYDNFHKLIGSDYTKMLKEAKIVSHAPLNYLRGNTFGTVDSFGNPFGSFCILDEAQNVTVKEMKLFISRMGENSKLVILGDSDQSDLKQNVKNGLDDAFERFSDLDGIGFVEFTDEDIVRDPFLVEIMKRYRS
jgi:phosphate starvation-inducible protein PhoH and related proteins